MRVQSINIINAQKSQKQNQANPAFGYKVIQTSEFTAAISRLRREGDLSLVEKFIKGFSDMVKADEKVFPEATIKFDAHQASMSHPDMGEEPIWSEAYYGCSNNMDKLKEVRNGLVDYMQLMVAPIAKVKELKAKGINIEFEGGLACHYHSVLNDILQATQDFMKALPKEERLAFGVSKPYFIGAPLDMRILTPGASLEQGWRLGLRTQSPSKDYLLQNLKRVWSEIVGRRKQTAKSVSANAAFKKRQTQVAQALKPSKDEPSNAAFRFTEGFFYTLAQESDGTKLNEMIAFLKEARRQHSGFSGKLTFEQFYIKSTKGGTTVSIDCSPTDYRDNVSKETLAQAIEKAISYPDKYKEILKDAKKQGIKFATPPPDIFSNPDHLKRVVGIVTEAMSTFKDYTVTIGANPPSDINYYHHIPYIILRHKEQPNKSKFIDIRGDAKEISRKVKDAYSKLETEEEMEALMARLVSLNTQ